MAKTASLHLRLDTSTKDALQMAADADGRKLSNLAEHILKEWLRAASRQQGASRPHQAA